MLEVVIEESYLNLFTGDKWTTHTNSPPPPPPPCTHSHMLRHTFSFSLYLSWCFNTYQLPPPPLPPTSLSPTLHTHSQILTHILFLPPSISLHVLIHTNFYPPPSSPNPLSSPPPYTHTCTCSHTHTLSFSLPLSLSWCFDTQVCFCSKRSSSLSRFVCCNCCPMPYTSTMSRIPPKPPRQQSTFSSNTLNLSSRTVVTFIIIVTELCKDLLLTAEKQFTA